MCDTERTVITHGVGWEIVGKNSRCFFSKTHQEETMMGDMVQFGSPEEVREYLRSELYRTDGSAIEP